MNATTNASDSYPHAEAVHRIFRGSTEFVKLLRQGAVSLEVVAALIAAVRTIAPGLSWHPLASLGLAALVVVGLALRLWAKTVSAHAERCRRLAIKAYGRGEDLSVTLASELKSEAPAATEFFALRLPAQSLSEYYEVVSAPGRNRLRELYVHSSFYTWRLLKVCGRMYAAVSIALAAVGFLVIYSLASTPSVETVSERLLDLVCSLIFAFLTGKSVQAAFDAGCSSASSQKIYDALLSAHRAQDIAELCAEYDVERASGVTIPTLIYLRYRDLMQREWHQIRGSL